MENKEWRNRNTMLQAAYQDYLSAKQQKEKDAASLRIQQALEWEPFSDLCYKHSADIYGISRHGLDYMSEQCIGIIDKITNEENTNL